MSFAYDSASSAKITVDEILDAYVSNPMYANKLQNIKEATCYWREFISIINHCAGAKIKYLNDIKPEWIKEWETQINKVATNKKYTRAYWLTPTHVRLQQK